MKTGTIDKELDAIKTVIHALEPLDEVQCAFVLKTVFERLNVKLPMAAQISQTHVLPPTSPGSAPSPSNFNGVTPKQFLKIKLPKTDVQRVACLAYFITHMRQQPHFKTEDLTNLNSEAGGVRFSNPHLAVKNATNQNGFLTPAGGGNKQITGIGEDLVDALPDQEAAKAALANHKKPRKKSSKRAAAKTK